MISDPGTMQAPWGVWINLHYLVLHKQIEQLVRKLPVQAVLYRQV